MRRSPKTPRTWKESAPSFWHCAARVNTSQVLRFSEEEKLQMVANIVCLVKKLDPDRPPMVGIDQPWGEYQGHRARSISRPSILPTRWFVPAWISRRFSWK